jgi:hypothetical protein
MTFRYLGVIYWINYILFVGRRDGYLIFKMLNTSRLGKLNLDEFHEIYQAIDLQWIVRLSPFTNKVESNSGSIISNISYYRSTYLPFLFWCKDHLCCISLNFKLNCIKIENEQTASVV